MIINHVTGSKYDTFKSRKNDTDYLYNLISVFIIITVFDILIWVNAFTDAKYYFGDDERYYLRIGSLSTAMFINLGIAIIAAVLLFTKKDK